MTVKWIPGHVENADPIDVILFFHYHPVIRALIDVLILSLAYITKLKYILFVSNHIPHKMRSIKYRFHLLYILDILVDNFW